MSTLGETMEQWNDIVKERMRGEIWGHLAPEEKRVYSGTILWTFGEYGDTTPIRVDFKDLPDSPWFYEDMQEFIGEASLKAEVGRVYRWTGTYRKMKNGRAIFKGKQEKVCL